MKPRKKNKFWTFVFSFVPGAAEMYMGFMKSGVSLLTICILPILLIGMLYGENYFMILSFIVYVVGFFHALNIAHMPDEEFEICEDRYIWEEFIDTKAINISSITLKKWTAIALIFLGACGIWAVLRENVLDMFSWLPESDFLIMENIMNAVPRLAFSILVIVIGIMIIRGKKNKLPEEIEYGTITNGSITDEGEK